MNGGKIFSQEASYYWHRNLDVLPIEPKSKRPAKELLGWQGFLGNTPNQDTREKWLLRYGAYGIGILLGGAIHDGHVLVAIDVDQDRFVNPIRALLGAAPCAKRGKKGITFFAASPAEPKPKKCQFRDHERNNALDFLPAGSMTVLPPTIHPETGQLYQWVGQTLLDTPLANLPMVDKRALGLIKAIVSSEYFDAIACGEGTHDPALYFAFELVKVKATDEEITNIITAMLPSGYQGNTLKELPEMLSSAREKVERGGGSVIKLTQAEKLHHHLKKQNLVLYRDKHDKTYLSCDLPSGGKRNLKIQSAAAAAWLKQLYYLNEGHGANRNTIIQVTEDLEAKALSEGERKSIYLRVAQENGRVILDLGRDDGQVVLITPDGWHVTPDSPSVMVRGAGIKELPIPVTGGSLAPLRDLLGLQGDDWNCLVAFMVNTLRGVEPYMAMFMDGPQGSGKSMLSTLIKKLLDPNAAEKLRLPQNDKDLMVHANNNHLIVYDNASFLTPEMSDSLCALASGGGMAVRSLFTNDEAHVVEYSRPFLINGITQVAARPDLLERGIPVHLKAMPAKGRKTERQILRKFKELHPQLLGALCDAVSVALNADPEGQPSQELRMIDAALWIEGGEPALGFSHGTLLASVKRAQEETADDQAYHDVVIDALLRYLLKFEGKFEGGIGELHENLTGGFNRPPRSFPASPSALSRWLRRIEPSLPRVGIAFADLGRTGKGRTIRLELTSGDIETPEF